MIHTFHPLDDVLHLVVEGELDALQVDAGAWERLRAEARDRAREFFGCTLYVDFRRVEFADSRSIFEVLDAIGVFRLGGEVVFVGPGPGIERLAKLGEAPLLAPMQPALPEAIEARVARARASEAEAREREAHEMEAAARALEIAADASEPTVSSRRRTRPPVDAPAVLPDPPEDVGDIPIVALADPSLEDLASAKTEDIGARRADYAHGTPAENSFIESIRTAIESDEARRPTHTAESPAESREESNEENCREEAEMPFEVDLELERRYLSSASDQRDFVPFPSKLEFESTWNPIEPGADRGGEPTTRRSATESPTPLSALAASLTKASTTSEATIVDERASSVSHEAVGAPRVESTSVHSESGLERIRRLAGQDDRGPEDSSNANERDESTPEPDSESGSHLLSGLGSVVRSLGAAEARVGVATQRAEELARAKDARIRELETRLEAEFQRSKTLAREIETLEARTPDMSAELPWEIERSRGLAEARRAFELAVSRYVQRGDIDAPTIEGVAALFRAGLASRFSITSSALAGDGGPARCFRAITIAGAGIQNVRPAEATEAGLRALVLAALAALAGTDSSPTPGTDLLAETDPPLVPSWRVALALAGDGTIRPAEWLERIVDLSTDAAAEGPEREALNDIVDALGLYPPGTWVEMQSGEIGVVVAPNPGKPHAPRVLLQFRRRGDRCIPWTPRWFPDERGELASITRVVNRPRLREDVEPAPPVEA